MSCVFLAEEGRRGKQEESFGEFGRGRAVLGVSVGTRVHLRP